MRLEELDYIFSTMLESKNNIPDLKITVDKPLQVETSGQLVPVQIEPPIEKLTPFQSEQIALNLVGGSRRLNEDLQRTGSCDCSYSVPNNARFRVNIFSQRG